MRILSVIPLKKGLLKGNLTYFSAKEIPNGSLVTIMLRSKKTLGLVVSSEDATKEKTNIKDMNFELKKIVEVKGVSVFLKEYLESIFLTSAYFAGSKNNAITSLIPSAFREQYDEVSRIVRNKYKDAPQEKEEKVVRAEKLILQEPMVDRLSVYKTLIRENFAQQKSVFIVLPTESDIGKLEEHLARGINEFTVSMHGGLNGKKIIEKFKKIMETDHPVLILGTAPFLSIPRRDIGVIVLEHESSSGYRMLSRPYFDMRIFAEIFASNINAKFVMGDTLLRLETISKKDAGLYTPLHPLSFRINWDGDIRVDSERSTKKNIPDTGAKAVEFKILPDSTIREIKQYVLKGKNVFVFALRRGLATVTACRDCGELVLCPKCLAPLVLYNALSKDEKVFICNKCSEEKSSKTVCTNCHSWNLNPLGIGTQTVVEYLEKIIKNDPELINTKIFRLDKEGAKTKKGAEKIAAEFEENPGSILVGTEMALFYIKEKVALSVIASFDSLWSIPNFKMSERVIQLSLSIIEKTEKRLIIHTKNRTDQAILALEDKNILSFIRHELDDRKKLGYPPFKRFIKIRYVGPKNQAPAVQEFLQEQLNEFKPLVFSGFIREARNTEVTNALIKLEPNEWSLAALSLNSSINERLLMKLLSLPPLFEISVDPEDLL